MLRCKSDIEGVIGRIGKLPSTILSSAIVLCIGPLLAIPRTAATVHEMTIMPIFGNVNVVITSVLFFLLILILCINESSVIDIVGKFLTPALIAGLIILIVKGIIDPIGNISPEPKITYIISEGISSGYQTMDVLASLIFGVIVLKSVKERGYTTEKKQFLVTGASGIVAGIGLFVIYGGLTYLGATSSELFTGRISRSELVINIVKMLFGNFGTIIFAIVVALACITTAAALVSSTGVFFNDITKGKLPYKGIVIFVCIFSAVTANLGLDYIIAVASPILSIIYPSAITLIVLTIFGERIKNDNVFKFAALGALISSIMEILMVNNIACHFMMKMPFASIGFSWVIPTIIFGIIGHFVKFGNNK